MTKKPHRTGPDKLAEFDRSLAGALNNWQIIESQCFMLFWHLSLYSKLKLPSLIFTHIRSFEQRLSLIDKILVATFKAETWPREEWKALLTRLKTAGGQRDRLVHYSIAHDPVDPYSIRIEPPYFDYIRRHGPKAFPKGSSDHYMGAKEIAKVMSSFVRLGLDLERFADKIEPVCEKLQKAAAQDSLKPSDPQPNPGQSPE